MAGKSSVGVKVLESVHGLVGVEKNTFLNHPDVIVTNDDSYGLFFLLTILSTNLAHSHLLCVCACTHLRLCRTLSRVLALLTYEALMKNLV